MKPKALEMVIFVTPRSMSGGSRVLAKFLLLWHPFRIQGCRLLQTPNGYDIQMPCREVRITREGKEVVISAAVDEFERATGA